MRVTAARRGLRWGLGLACCLAALLATFTASAEDRYREDAVKAAFLYRFTGYVDWPREALAAPTFTIAVLAADPVAQELTRLLPGRAIKNLPTQIRIVRKAQEAADAQLLYVGSDYTGDLEEVTESLATRPVLVVTDRPDGLNAGSAINFLLVDQRVRFEIAMPAVVRCGLWVQPPLLAVAVRVRGVSRSDAPHLVPAASHRPLLARW